MTARVALGEIAKIYSGGTPSRSNPSYWDGDIPWIKTTQIQNGLITNDEVDEWITEDGLKNSSAKIVPKGTILMAMYGQGKTRGQVAILGIDAAINQACAAIQLKDGISRDFIYQQLLFHYNSIRGLSNTGGQQNLSAELLRETSLSLPSYHEQITIANLLLIWDSAIEILDQLILAKQEQRKGLMQQLLSGKRRFPGFTRPWQEVSLGEVFSNRTEAGRTDLPLVSITGNEGVVFRDGLDRKDTSSADKSKYLRICPGDIGYNTMRMWQGVSGLSKIEGIVSPAYTIVTPDESLDPEFMALLFKYPPIVHLFYRYSQGLVSDTWNLKFRHFSEIRVRLPEKKEQEAIAAVFRPVDKELSLLRQQLEAFKEQKKGLMQKLLTGKVRVKPAKEAVA